jgi:FHS family L-fucose permease-like MFS transporter
MNDTPKRIALPVVSIVFFTFGFVTCLNDILIPHLKSVFSLNYAESALIQFAFFGAYFIFALPAGRAVRRLGYKNTIVAGLLISMIGALIFFPAARTLSFGVFLAALFTLAAGFTFLQVAANPYVTLLGEPELASSRLTLVQGLNSFGTMVAPKVGSVLILTGVALTATELAQLSPAEQAAHALAQARSVEFPYAVIAGIFLVLAAFIYWIRLPDSKQESASSDVGFKEVFKVKRICLGVMTLFLYVGAEVAIGSFLINFISQPDIGAMSEAAAANYVPFYWGGAMLGRFLGSAILQKINPGKVLGVFALIAASLVGVTIVTHGAVALTAIVAVGLFNSIMFPTAFSLSIQGAGRLTEKASSLLIMAIVGGAIIPPLQGLLADRIGLHSAFVLPLLCYFFIAFFGFWCAGAETATDAAASEMVAVPANH